MIRGRGPLKRLILDAGLESVLLVGLLFGTSGSAILAAPTVAQEPDPGEPDPIEAGLAPTSLPYAPGIDVLHYDFELALSETDKSFLGRAQVRLALLEPLPEVIALDLTGLAVDAVRIDGREAAFELMGGQLRIARPADRFLMYADLAAAQMQPEDVLREADRHFNHQKKLEGYRGPLLVLHTENDGLVDIAHAEQNFQWAASSAEAKKLVRFANGDHNSILAVNHAEYFRAVKEFLETQVTGQ